jgi:Helix-turn-helix domain
LALELPSSPAAFERGSLRNFISEDLIVKDQPRVRAAQDEPLTVATSKTCRTNPLRTDEEAALRLNVSPSLMRSWRCRGIGPNYRKLGPGRGAPVRYSDADLDEFIEQGRRVPPVRAAMEK